jgi:hypothetical protein
MVALEDGTAAIAMAVAGLIVQFLGDGTDSLASSEIAARSSIITSVTVQERGEVNLPSPDRNSTYIADTGDDPLKVRDPVPVRNAQHQDSPDMRCVT